MSRLHCELCWAELDDETMVSQGEFFVCEDCEDKRLATEAAKEPTVTLDEVQSELATKH